MGGEVRKHGARVPLKPGQSCGVMWNRVGVMWKSGRKKQKRPEERCKKKHTQKIFLPTSLQLEPLPSRGTVITLTFQNKYPIGIVTVRVCFLQGS